MNKTRQERYILSLVYDARVIKRRLNRGEEVGDETSKLLDDLDNFEFNVSNPTQRLTKTILSKKENFGPSELVSIQHAIGRDLVDQTLRRLLEQRKIERIRRGLYKVVL